MAENILNEARFDDNVRQWMASGGPSYSTSIVSVQSGDEQRARNWINSRGMWNIGDRNVPMSKYQQLLSFFHRVRGRHVGFRIRDWTDFADDGRGVLGAGTGTGDLSYQMNKIRTIDGVAGASYQKITRPVGPSFASSLGNTVEVYLNGIEVPQGATPGSCMVNDSTGVVVFVPYTWGVVEIQSGNTIVLDVVHNLSAGEWLVLDNFGNGNDGLARVLSVVSPTSVVLAKALTPEIAPAEAVAMNLPGPTDAITWTGQYDIPARFDIDQFTMNTIEAFIEGGQENNPSDVWIRLGSIPVIQLRE